MSQKYRGVGKDFGSTQLKSVADPTLANDAATKGYVDSLVNGLAWHPAVRASVASNVTVANPGTAIFDGVTLVNGERILLRGQSAPAENGPWVFTGSGTAMTRPADFANAVVAPPATGIINATFFVQEGTSFADTAWTLTTNGPITVGTTALAFTQFGGGSGPTLTASLGVVRVADDFRLASGVGGDGITLTAGVLDVDSTVARTFETATHAATTSIAVTHSLGKRYVCAHVYIDATGEEIECDVVATSTTVTTFSFAVAPSLNTLRFVIHA